MQGEEFWSQMRADTEEEHTDQESSESGRCWDYLEEEDDIVVERLTKFQRQAAS